MSMPFLALNVGILLRIFVQHSHDQVAIVHINRYRIQYFCDSLS